MMEYRSVYCLRGKKVSQWTPSSGELGTGWDCLPWDLALGRQEQTAEGNLWKRLSCHQSLKEDPNLCVRVNRQPRWLFWRVPALAGFLAQMEGHRHRLHLRNDFRRDKGSGTLLSWDPVSHTHCLYILTIIQVIFKNILIKKWAMPKYIEG